jgi:4-amino-4-deoxy-L-arabinose transferase-like glycosyltransferase
VRVLWNQLKQVALVAAIAALVMLTNLGGPRLWDRDEPRNAGAAREMLWRSDWVVPTFNGELRTHKPVLLYWCIMASYLGLGVSEFAARLPSALCAIGTCICVYRMGRRLFGPQAAVWAGIALATSLMFVVAGRAATPDSLLIFCTSLALMIYVCGTFRPRFDTTPVDSEPQLHSSPHAPREVSITRSVTPTRVAGQYFPQHWPTVVVMYAAMGLGGLAKGPVGLVLPTAVIGMFLLIVRLPRWNSAEGRNATEGVPYSAVLRLIAPLEPLHFLRTCWSMRPLTALFAASAVAVPWYLAVGLATDGEFLRGFFLEHNLGRATGVMEHHGGFIFFYPVTILVGFFPWSIFAIPLAIDTVLQLRRRDRFHAGYLLAVCWIGVYVVLFSLARTKLPSYVTPCYPALALLAGDYIDRWSRQSAAVAGRWLVTAFGCLALIGIAVAIAVPMVARRYLPGEEWLGLLGLVPLAGGVACMGLVAARSYKPAAAALAATAVGFVTMLFAVGTERIDRHQASHRLWEAVYARSADPQIASYKVLEPSWVFYSGRFIREFGALLDRPSRENVAAYLAHSPDAFVITTEKKLAEVSHALSPNVGIIATAPYFLKDGETLVLLGTISHHDARFGSDPHRFAGQPAALEPAR